MGPIYPDAAKHFILVISTNLTCSPNLKPGNGVETVLFADKNIHNN